MPSPLGTGSRASKRSRSALLVGIGVERGLTLSPYLVASFRAKAFWVIVTVPLLRHRSSEPINASTLTSFSGPTQSTLIIASYSARMARYCRNPLLVSHFQKMFSSAFRAGHIAKSVPTKCVKPGSTAKLAQMQDVKTKYDLVNAVAGVERGNGTIGKTHAVLDTDRVILVEIAKNAIAVSPSAMRQSSPSGIERKSEVVVEPGETMKPDSLRSDREDCVFSEFELGSHAVDPRRPRRAISSCICANFAVEPGFTHLVGTDLAIWPARKAELNIF